MLRQISGLRNIGDYSTYLSLPNEWVFSGAEVEGKRGVSAADRLFLDGFMMISIS